METGIAHPADAQGSIVFFIYRPGIHEDVEKNLLNFGLVSIGKPDPLPGNGLGGEGNVKGQSADAIEVCGSQIVTRPVGIIACIGDSRYSAQGFAAALALNEIRYL